MEMEEKYLERPWLKEYKFLGYQESLEPYPDEPTFALLDYAAENFPNVGFVQPGIEMKYPKIKEQAYKFATALADLGVKKGDKIVTLLPSSIQFVVTDYGISRAGAVQVPCSYLESVSDLEYKFEESGAKTVVCIDTVLDKVKKIREDIGLENVIVTKLEDYSHNPPLHEDLNDMFWLTDLIARTPLNPPEVEINVEKDLETLIFTGGTTGRPKGCMLTHRNITANAMQVAAMIPIVGGPGAPLFEIIRGKLPMGFIMPFFHAYGHEMVYFATYMGFNALIVPDARDTKSMVQMIRNYYPVFVIGIPTQILKMLKEDLGGIGSIFYTGAASLAPEIQDRYEEQTGGGLGTGGMGLSECSPVTHLNYSFVYRLLGGKYITRLVSEIVKTTNRNLLQMPRVTTFIENLLTSFGPKNIGMLTSRIIPLISRSVAKLPFSKKQEVRRTVGIPLQDMEMRVIDVDTGKKLSLDELEDDKRGEMIIKGVNRMLGYWPEEGKGLDEEGYIHTGDVVRVDKNGYFYVVDRTKDIINVSGLKVYSEEMDDLLYGHPGVEFAATIGVPDRERPGSERVKVYIELKPDYKGKTNEQEIIDFLRDRVPKYAVPTYVEFIDQIPLTDVQKVDKKAIRNIEAKKQRVI